MAKESKESLVHGFRLVRSRWEWYPHEKFYEWEHVASGARVFWYRNEEPEYIALVGVRTPAADDSGVAHVLEHIIGHGSERYPDEHLVANLMHFHPEDHINAYTNPFLTAYHFQTRSKEKFRYYLDVWLDNVFHPTCLADPRFFAQEGWRYDVTPDGRLYRTGVVLNEMRYAKKDSLYMCIAQALQPEACEAYCSGGRPEALVKLTHEKVVAFHKKYYHPSNACVFLTGAIDIDATLAFLDAQHFAGAERCAPAAMPPAAPWPDEPMIGEGMRPCVDPEDDGTATLGLAWLLDEDAPWLTGTELTDLSRWLFSKETRLPPPVGDRDPEELRFQLMTVAGRDMLVLAVHHMRPEDLMDFASAVHSMIGYWSGRHLPPRRALRYIEELEAPSLDGVADETPDYMDNCHWCVLYWAMGRSPFDAFTTKSEALLLREHIADGSLDRVAQKIATEFPTLFFSVTASTERYLAQAAAREKELRERQAAMTAEDLAAIRAENRAFRAWQAELAEKGAASMPVLQTEPPDADLQELAASQHGPTQLLAMTLDLEETCFLVLAFDASAFTSSELTCLHMLAGIFEDCCREETIADTPFAPFAGILLSFDAYLRFDEERGSRASRPLLQLRFECRVRDVYAALRLVRVLLDLEFPRKETIHPGLRRALRAAKRWNRRLRDDAAFTFSQFNSHIDAGEAAYWRLSRDLRARMDDCLVDLDAAFPALQRDLEGALAKLRSRPCTLAFFAASKEAQPRVEEQLIAFLDRYPQDAPPLAPAFTECPTGREGFFARSQGQFIARGANFRDLGWTYHGSMDVLTRLLIDDYLEPLVRQAGGAYLAGAHIGLDGTCVAYSGYDPHLQQTLDVFSGAADFVRTLDVTDTRLRAAIAAVDISEELSPIDDALATFGDWKLGYTPEDRRRHHAELLATTVGELRSYAPMIEASFAKGDYVVCGKESLLRQNAALFDRIGKRG